MTAQRTSSIVLLALLAGCSTERVVLVDARNRPIASVSITPMSGSSRGDPVLTDSAGRADVSLRHVYYSTDRLELAKKGYPTTTVRLPDRWPLVVRLGAIAQPPVVWTPMTPLTPLTPLIPATRPTTRE